MIAITDRKKVSVALRQVGWWVFFIVCTVFALYALKQGVTEILSWLGIPTDAKFRTVPVIFVVHALTGSATLISGALQFNRRILSQRRLIHRISGRVYVYAIWLASVTGLVNAIFFDVNLAAKIVFGALSILWFSATTIAFLRIRKREFKEHREWMIRSFALSLFFVTFNFWVTGLTKTSLPRDISYPLGVFLSWAVNLIIAEIWIRFTRNTSAVREFIASVSDIKPRISRI